MGLTGLTFFSQIISVGLEKGTKGQRDIDKEKKINKNIKIEKNTLLHYIFTYMKSRCGTFCLI